MIDRQSLLAQLLMGPPQPATRLEQLLAMSPADALRASLPPLPTPETRAGRPNRLAELTMPSAEFEPAVRPFGSPHVPAVTTPSEERRLVDLAMMLSSFVGNIRAPSAVASLFPPNTPPETVHHTAKMLEPRRRWYHGTAGTHTSFDPRYEGAVTKSTDGGLWLTRSRSEAGDYAVRAIDPLGGDPRVMRVHVAARRPAVATFADDGTVYLNGRVIDAIDNADIVKAARKGGHDMVVFPQGNFSEPTAAAVVLDPRLARFVPD